MIPFTDILKTIELIRESFDESVEVYTKGSCVRFALILKHIYPQGEVLWNENHAIFEYDGRCYDINGFADKEDHIPLMKYGILKINEILKLKYKK